MDKYKIKEDKLVYTEEYPKEQALQFLQFAQEEVADLEQRLIRAQEEVAKWTLLCKDII